VLLRINDVCIGVITGAICSVVAATYEVFIGGLRIFSFAHLGGAFGSTFVVLAALGAVIGGLVAWIGTVVKPREREHVR